MNRCFIFLDGFNDMETLFARGKKMVKTKMMHSHQKMVDLNTNLF